MPIDYKLYHPNWKTVIRPDILNRDENCCKFCKVPNGITVCRGKWCDVDAYQDEDGEIFDADNGTYLGDDYVGEVWGGTGKQVIAKIVLTIAHLDHNIDNNNYDNLAALCQRCHNRYDRKNRDKNRKANKLKKQPELFNKC